MNEGDTKPCCTVSSIMESYPNIPVVNLLCTGCSKLATNCYIDPEFSNIHSVFSRYLRLLSCPDCKKQ